MLSLVLALLLVLTSHAVQPDVAARAKEVLAFLSADNFAAVEAQFTRR